MLDTFMLRTNNANAYWEVEVLRKIYNKKGREHWKFLVIFLKEALKFQSSIIASISKSSPKSFLKKKEKKVLTKVSY